MRWSIGTHTYDTERDGLLAERVVDAGHTEQAYLVEATQEV
jgi:hypothetical protein